MAIISTPCGSCDELVELELPDDAPDQVLVEHHCGHRFTIEVRPAAAEAVEVSLSDEAVSAEGVS